jgi:hypothetical protein
MSGGYNPKVSMPRLSNNIPQMKSGDLQTPFFFGGAQAPIALGLPAGSFSGSGFSKSVSTKTNKGDVVYHTGDKFVRKTRMPFMKK